MRARPMISPVVAAVMAGFAALLGLTTHALAGEEEVSFAGSGGLPLRGTWTLADGDGGRDGAPAVLLLQGSGATDRNGNQADRPRGDLMAELAEALADEGVASLRFDKRGMHANAAQRPVVVTGRAGSGPDTGALAAFFAWEAMAGDAARALAYVAGREDSDPARLGIVGHSQGATLALAALTAADTPTPPVKALGLLASPSRPATAVIRRQVVRRLDRWGLDGEARDSLLTINDKITAEIIETGRVPRGVPPLFDHMYPSYAGPFLKGWLTFEPLAAVMAVARPTLVVIGGADTQVSARDDGARFLRVLQDRNDGSVILLPERVGHALQRMGAGATDNPDPEDGQTLRKTPWTPDDELLETVAEWVAAAL
ncbi:MAG: dienelactone hydrolase family protein [Alphaproteobacteria bacterium]